MTRRTDRSTTSPARWRDEAENPTASPTRQSCRAATWRICEGSTCIRRPSTDTSAACKRLVPVRQPELRRPTRHWPRFHAWKPEMPPGVLSQNLPFRFMFPDLSPSGTPSTPTFHRDPCLKHGYSLASNMALAVEGDALGSRVRPTRTRHNHHEQRGYHGVSGWMTEGNDTDVTGAAAAEQFSVTLSYRLSSLPTLLCSGGPADLPEAHPPPQDHHISPLPERDRVQTYPRHLHDRRFYPSIFWVASWSGWRPRP